MTPDVNKKKVHDQKRTEWRKSHRSLNGRIIIYPDKPPEHINARGNKMYYWFWKNILLPINMHDIPPIITSIKQQMRNEADKRKIRKLRTMIGMADDAYQLKQIENIDNYDGELQLTNTGAYNSDQGIVYQGGGYITTDLSEDEDKIIIRDMDGVIIDVFYGNEVENNGSEDSASPPSTMNQ